MTKASKKQQPPDPAPLTVTHAPATRLEDGKVLLSPDDHELHHLETAEVTAIPSVTEGSTNG